MIKILLNSGLNKIRDLLNTNLTKGQNGTGTSTVSEGDTGLDVAVGSTLKTLSANVGDRVLTTTHVLNTTEGNNLSLTEFENQFNTGESLIRIRHTPITKDNTKELTFITTYELSKD